MRERLSGVVESVRASFGAPAALAIALALAAGFYAPTLRIEWAPTFAFESFEASTAVLQTIAASTVSVAGLSFSVTLVAFTLASSQLSPRVLRSFRRDRLVQVTLAIFLGTFAYCLAVLVRMSPERDVPQLAITLAIVLAVAAFGLFTVFIAHIVGRLQPSSIIAAVVDDAETLLEHPFPARTGHPADREPAERRMAAGPGRPVRADGQGYLVTVRGSSLLEAARGDDALVRQAVQVGEYVLPGQVVAEVWGGGEALDSAVRRAFTLDTQRTVVQDVAFPVRQLADIALKGLSPGINDPTTAENALDALAGVLVRVARAEPPCPVRGDEDGRPLLVASPPSLDELVALGFGQVRLAAADHPRVLARIAALHAHIAAEADRARG